MSNTRSLVSIKHSSFAFRYFCKMLHAFSSSPIYNKYVKPPHPEDPTPACIADDLATCLFFKDAIGAAVDGMHIMFAPTTRHGAFRNRRGFYSQYCLVCCNFNLEFTYVVSGWEGCASDEQVYCNARVENLPVPTGTNDAAFPGCPQLLLPYRGIQHHMPGLEREHTRYIPKYFYCQYSS